MTTYVYQTIPEDESTEPEYFEFQQDMNDAPLTEHPETGVPVKRVVLGGYGMMTSSPPSPEGPSSCCGSSGCC